MSQRTYKRRQYIVDKSFQYGLIRKFAIVTAFIVVGSLSFLVLVYYKYGDVQVAIVQPVPFDSTDNFGNNETIRAFTLVDILWPVLSICLVGTIIFTFFFSVIVSHRMAGPVYRMRQLLEEMAQGDLGRPVSRLRKKDEFKHLFSDINNVKEYWRSQIEELQCICREFGEDGNQEKHLKRLNEIISSFKTKENSSGNKN
jgi:methyl-accepting chemotaxis protein